MSAETTMGKAFEDALLAASRQENIGADCEDTVRAIDVHCENLPAMTLLEIPPLPESLAGLPVTTQHAGPMDRCQAMSLAKPKWDARVNKPAPKARSRRRA